MLPAMYDDALPEEYEYSQPHMSTDGTRPSAPQFSEHLHLFTYPFIGTRYGYMA